MHLTKSYCRSIAVSVATLASAIALSFSATALAQTSIQADTRQWRNANGDVGRYTRGHIDLLKAERGRVEIDSNLTLSAFKEDATAPVLSEEAARKAVLMLHADLLSGQAISAPEKYARDSQLLSIQQSTQKLWTEAVAAKEQLTIQQRIAEAASVSLELAKRMTKVGNWGRNRLVDIEISYQSARSQLILAEQAAVNSHQRLFAQIGSDQWRLPKELPKPVALNALSELSTPPEQLLLDLLARHPHYTLLDKEANYYERIVGNTVLEQWQQQLDGLVSASPTWTNTIPTLNRTKIFWSHDLEKAIKARTETRRLNAQIKSDLYQAHAQLRAAHSQATDIFSKLAQLHTSAEEEALMRYNGMFISTWDLIAKAQTKMQSELAIAQAKQFFWIALVDMRAVLAGAPYAGPAGSVGNSASATSSSKGH